MMIIALSLIGMSADSIARRQVVRDLVTDHRCNIVCLQETKLANVDDSVIIQTLGQQFVGSYSYLPADGTRGGVIIACSQDHYNLHTVATGQHAVSANITSRADNSQWSITGVYGPQEDQEKIQFITEISSLRQQMHSSWVGSRTSISFTGPVTKTMIELTEA